MKNMKKLASLLLALVMVFSLATTAFAANENQHTITIKNTDQRAGYTYEAYRVFEGDLDDDGELKNINWSNGVNATALLTALKQIDAFAACETAVDVANVLSGITAANNATTQAFADAVAANLATVAGTATSKADQNCEISVTGDGYYFIKTTAVPAADNTVAEGVHTRYILKVVDDVDVNHKGTVPKVEKKIVEGTAEVDSTDKNIGDTVDFKLTATLPNDYTLFKTYTVTFHDTMSDGLTNATDFEVYIDGTRITSGYEVVTTGITDGCTFEVKIADVKATTAKNNSTIVVTYTATLDSDAVIGDPGNDNKVKLEYSNNPNEEQDGTPETGETPEDKVVVFTYQMDTTKVDGVDNTITLANAKFSLLSADGSKIAKIGSDGKIVSWDEVSGVTATDGVYPDDYTLTTGESGVISVKGLDAGTYQLKETVAPTGYNLPEEPFNVVITATTSVDGITALAGTIDSVEMTATKAEGKVEGIIENNSGATLPETGGMGTTLFYVFGGILVAAAAVLLVTKKRVAE